MTTTDIARQIDGRSADDIQALLDEGVSLDTEIRVACIRCNGRGVIDIYRYVENGICFDCNGNGNGGSVTLRVLVRRMKGRQAAARRREAKAAERAAQAVVKAAEREAELAAKRATFAAEHAEVVAYVAQMSGDLGSSLREALETYGALTDRQVELVRERMAQPTAPVPTGRVQVTGTVLATKWVENYNTYPVSSTQKMLVQDDSGYRVWGTVPRALSVSKGSRVTFTAKVEPSSDDESFGFYSRPTKAAMA